MEPGEHENSDAVTPKPVQAGTGHLFSDIPARQALLQCFCGGCDTYHAHLVSVSPFSYFD